MILLKEWGKHIRLGNWLYLWAEINKLAHLTGHEIYLPEDYFLWDWLEHPPLFDKGIIQNGENFHFKSTQYSEQQNQEIIGYFRYNKDKNININLGSNCQSSLFWADDEEYVNSRLKLKQDKIDEVKTRYSHVFEKETVAISIRRGDFVNHGAFVQIDLQWYLDALYTKFPNWRDMNIFFFSDDIEEIKRFFIGDNFYFSEPNGTQSHANNFREYHQSPMDQFALAISCNHAIISNSTFSYWIGYYIDRFNKGRVINCGENLRGKDYETFYNPDYYDKHWEIYPLK